VPGRVGSLHIPSLTVTKPEQKPAREGGPVHGWLRR
jgi:hypothetical protein